MNLEQILLQCGDDFIRSAYRSILGREVDIPGLLHFKNKLRRGCGKEFVLVDLYNSQESKSRLSHSDLSSAPDEYFIEKIYERILHRPVDQVGKAHYLNMLKNSGERQRIIDDIERSVEAKEKNANEYLLREQLAVLTKEIKKHKGLFSWWGSSRRVERQLEVVRNLIEESYVCLLKTNAENTSTLASQLRTIALQQETVVKELSNIGRLVRANQDFSILSLQKDALANEDLYAGETIHVENSPLPLGASAEFNSSFSFEGQLDTRQRILNPTLGVIYYYVDHTVHCPVNTGVQRVVRQLARTLLELGNKIVFVKWHSPLNRLVLVNQLELSHLAEWGGPKLNENQVVSAGYPANNECEPIMIEGSNFHDRNWLIVPEVSHINFHDRQLTLEIIMAAKRAALRTAFVFYDAIPLRRAELASVAPLHEAYMRQLLHADIILPISTWSAKDLKDFLQTHELVDEAFLPVIEPLLLPAEVYGEVRVTSCKHRSVGVRKILCVGSIDERKNQLVLVRAFIELALSGQADNWQLSLVGNCNPSLHAELKKMMELCPAVVWFGPISDQELKQAYLDCDFTVFPSVEEGFGLPIAESLWFGKPCLCANFGPMAEIALNGGCLQVDMYDQKTIKNGLLSMIRNEALRNQLTQQAHQRDLASWRDYGYRFLSYLECISNPVSSLQAVYYLVDHTVSFNRNSGIQRVVRGLAAALQRLGIQIIAAKWNETKTALIPPTRDELIHLSNWNGPVPSAWATWREPTKECQRSWVIFPEATPHYTPEEYLAMRNYLSSNSLRGCWLFHDAIPWKLTDIYSVEARHGHRNYMAGLNLFELILANSNYTREQLELFYLGEPQPTLDLSHRLIACSLPGEFLETPRVFATKENHEQPIHVLSVGTLEPRKNHLTLVQAFIRVCMISKRPMRLTLAGAGPFQEIANQITVLTIENENIQWIQSPSDTELNELYKECDFTVYPSYEEGFGLPILESLWHARPCICMNAGAMAEVGVGGGCLLVNTTSEEDLAAAIQNLCVDDALRHSLACQAVARTFRTWDDYANDFALRMAEEHWNQRKNNNNRLAVSSSQADMNKNLNNMTKRPLLSVCISTYNRARWLTVSLAVLLREVVGLEGKVEVLVCDNTSQDNTPDIVSPYISQGLVRYHRNQENVGMLGNLRITAQEARGEYIWILGDDDLLKPGAVHRVVGAIEENPGLSMVYLNYAYTREDSPEAITDLDSFFAGATPVADGVANFRGQVKDVTVMNENFFTAIYCIVFQRAHALLAYSQFTEGEPFSSLPTCVPTTNHVLHFMMNLPAYWIADPQIVINLNVSWMRYAWRWILERFPEIRNVAVRYGADATKVDRWTDHHLSSIEHFLNEVYTQLDPEITKQFDIVKLLLNIKHTKNYNLHKPAFMAIYTEAFNNKHPLAQKSPDSIFIENN